MGGIARNSKDMGRSSVLAEALLSRPSARAAVAAVAQRYKPAAVGNERRKRSSLQRSDPPLP